MPSSKSHVQFTITPSKSYDKSMNWIMSRFEIATTVTGETDLGKLEAAVAATPELITKFQEQMNNLTVQLYQEDTERMGLVNKTMQSESVSGSWAQRSWRPFNGFLFGITIWFDYFGTTLLQAILNKEFVWTHVPMPVYVLWAAVLGVTAYTRGKEKVNRVKGILDILKW